LLYLAEARAYLPEIADRLVEVRMVEEIAELRANRQFIDSKRGILNSKSTARSVVKNGRAAYNAPTGFPSVTIACILITAVTGSISDT
jgi:hypothetical protein